jgi:exosome complex component CSL4
VTPPNRPSIALPGDRLAVIEEFQLGQGVYLWGAEIRAKQLGSVRYDYKAYKVHVIPKKAAVTPSRGDLVDGIVYDVAHKYANLKLTSINAVKLRNLLPAVLLLPADERIHTPVKNGDLVRAKVVGIIGGFAVCSIEGEGLGVLVRHCSKCGDKSIKIGPRLVKCIACGNRERVYLAD